MSDTFNPKQGPIIVLVTIEGPSGKAILRLALDTGATSTLINAAPLVALGYKPALAGEQVQVTPGSGVEFAPRVELDKVTALGRTQTNFRVLCHTLPPSAGVDGLLGLDFMRRQVLTVDLIAGQVTLTP